MIPRNRLLELMAARTQCERELGAVEKVVADELRRPVSPDLELTYVASPRPQGVIVREGWRCQWLAHIEPDEQGRALEYELSVLIRAGEKPNLALARLPIPIVIVRRFKSEQLRAPAATDEPAAWTLEIHDLTSNAPYGLTWLSYHVSKEPGNDAQVEELLRQLTAMRQGGTHTCLLSEQTALVAVRAVLRGFIER